MVVGCHRSKGDPFSNPDRQKALLVAGCVWCQQQTDPCGVTWVLGPQQGHCLVQVVAGTNIGARSGSPQVHCRGYTAGTTTGILSLHTWPLYAALQHPAGHPAQGQGPHRYTVECRGYTCHQYAALQHPGAASIADTTFRSIDSSR